MNSETVTLRSDAETLQADLYGALPAKRAVVLVHGAGWDANGWREYAPRFVERGVPALALNLRGHDGSTGNRVVMELDRTTDEYAPPAPWSLVADLRAAKAVLRERGASEIALVGCSLGGHAVIGSSLEADIECVVCVSAPVAAVPDDLARRMTGRKLFVCATQDPSGAARHARRCHEAAAEPKELVFYEGREHARGMFAAPYGREVIEKILDFVARGL
jgi:pimeloyl-ACP methyl ester carboxylesterase